MDDQLQVEPLGAHRYLVLAREGEDVVELVVDASPALIARLAGGDATAEPEESRIIEATAAFLIARQRADDLPPEIDLEDVAAAYDGFEDELRHRLAGEA
jgi:hypothetical protein